MHIMSLYRECGSHNFAAADGHLPEVPSVLLQDSIEERWVQVCTYVRMYNYDSCRILYRLIDVAEIESIYLYSYQ